ncbi:MAG: DNA polymerase/3'-5' exonuclease PolX, partial [Chitinophagaceae bacterium]|nr:DNA polymerase/3'-5' exonuclease PolX [Chitinophagaceae bacterium]
AKLMDIHGENSFKAKSYSSAAFNIEKLPVQLSDLPPEKIFSLKGIGESTGKKIIEIIKNGNLSALEDIALKTPPGVIEMLSIKGLGPKKIAIIWKEMEIESPGELLYACTENRLTRYKGFGEKSQQSIQEAINFYLKSQGNHLFAEIESYALQLTKVFQKAFPENLFEITGGIKRQSETIDKLEWVTDVPVEKLQAFFTQNNYTEEEIQSGSIAFSTPENVLIQFYSRTKDVFYATLFETSSSPEFYEAWEKTFKKEKSAFSSEEAIFKSKDIPFIPASLREKPAIITRAQKEDLSKLIQPTDIRAIIHSHSKWSDGSNTIEEMAKACIDRGLEYLVISDHSKSAAYANGLSEERIKEQHREIDELNKKLAPFKIFKSIESDILGDGSLDYSDRILSTFDLVIASVHSNLKMSEEKAMSRLLNAISNPYTTILGHMTGRLLLSRPGYPVDYTAIIDACAKNNVAIEINANPRRLDMSWEWVDYALEKNVLLSIDPDAHEISEYDNNRYGVLAAQKGGLTPDRNLSSFSLKDFNAFLSAKEASRKK